MRTAPLVGPGPIGIFDLADDGVGDATFPPHDFLGGNSAVFGDAMGLSFDFDVTLVVPEPTSAVTALLGTLAVLALRRRST